MTYSELAEWLIIKKYAYVKLKPGRVRAMFVAKTDKAIRRMIPGPQGVMLADAFVRECHYRGNTQ